VKSTNEDLFSLDFHSPAPSLPQPVSAQTGGGRKDFKSNILSLYAAAPPAGTGALGGGGFGVAPAQAAAPQPTSMMGNTGTGMWGTQSGWNVSQPQQSTSSWGQSPPSQPAAFQNNVWGQPTQQQQPFGAFGGAPTQAPNSMYASQNIWGASAQPAVQPDLFGSFGTAAPAQPAAKKDDAFGDLWGGFK